jgi:glycosyltransferase involved in cell wall biosynthesis
VKKLAILTTHPIQYNAPVFKLLQQRRNIDIKVFYTWGEEVLKDKYDPGFGKNIEWDIPLLEGYDAVFVKNVAKDPGSHHFKGIDNPNLIQEIEEWNADAILVFGWSFKSHLKALRHFSGKRKILFRGDSTLLDEVKGIKQRLRRSFLKWVYSHVDVALYVGQNNKNYFLTHGLKERQLILAPHAIDNDRFNKIIEKEEIVAERTRLGIDNQDFVLLFAGKLEPKKQPDYLIQLGTRLKSYPSVKFLIVGNGIMESELKESVKEDKRFIFLNFQNQTRMPFINKMADMLILPSKGPGETWGLAINEAMACGLPVAASNKCGGAIDLIDKGRNGVIFAPDDWDTVEKFVLELAGDSAQYARAVENSHAIIERFSFTHIAAAIESAV